MFKRKKKQEPFYAEYLPKKSRTEREGVAGPLQTIVRLRILTSPNEAHEIYEVDVPKVNLSDIFFPIEPGDESWKYNGLLQDVPDFLGLRRQTLLRYDPDPLTDYLSRNQNSVYRKSRLDREAEASKTSPADESGPEGSGSTSYDGLPAIGVEDPSEETDHLGGEDE